MSDQKKKSEFGIWVKPVKLKTGEIVNILNFSVNGTRYTAWPNKYKQNEKSPEYNVYIDNYVKPEGQPTPAPMTNNNYQGRTTNTPLADNRSFAPAAGNSDDLPF